MDIDLDTFLTAVYVTVDALCPPTPHLHSGPHPRMSESEVLTLLLVGHWRGVSERALLRWAGEHLRGYFPYVLSQSAFNRRARALAGKLIPLMIALGTQTAIAADTYEVVDCVPVPLAQPCRGMRHRRFAPDEANVGRGGVGKRFYYGVSLLLSVAASGPITGLIIAPANVEERWLLSALLTWRADPTAVPMTEDAVTTRNPPAKPYVGPTGALLGPATAGGPLTGHYLADQGFTGMAWQAHWQEDLHARVWTHETLASPLRHWFHHRRQIIETVNGQLTDVLHLKFPQAHTHQGLIVRVAAKCAAFNLGMLLNHRYQRPSFALGTLFTG